jgi:hypothetical protein
MYVSLYYLTANFYDSLLAIWTNLKSDIFFKMLVKKILINKEYSKVIIDFLKIDMRISEKDVIMNAYFK